MDTHDHLPQFCHRYNTSTLSESPSGHTRHCCRVRSDSASDDYPKHASGLGAGSLFPTLSPQPLSACLHACVRWWWLGGYALLSSVRGVAAFQHVFPMCSGECRQQVTAQKNHVESWVCFDESPVMLTDTVIPRRHLI